MDKFSSFKLADMIIKHLSELDLEGTFNDPLMTMDIKTFIEWKNQMKAFDLYLSASKAESPSSSMNNENSAKLETYWAHFT